MGFRLNMFLNVMTPLIMVISFSDSMQLTFAARDRLLSGQTKYEALRNSILVVGPACVLTREHARLWGSSRCKTHGVVFVFWLEVWIEAPERPGECFVENGDAHVEERLHGPSIPSHLLFLDHAL